MSTLGVLTLVGLALFAGGLFLRRLPPAALALGAVMVAFGVGIPAIVIDDNRSETAASGSEEGGGASAGDSAETGAGGGSGGGATGGGQAADASEEGKLIFVQSCGTCHVLADAGTNGQVGPSLDQLKPDQKRVEAAIKNGGTGSGTMPANLVTGKEAKAVAKYVAEAAGK